MPQVLSVATVNDKFVLKVEGRLLLWPFMLLKALRVRLARSRLAQSL